MLEQVPEVKDSWKGAYIRLTIASSPGWKTKIWNVLSEHGAYLGVVKWYGPWRKYCFYPHPESVFEQVCLREIAQFIEERTRDHRAERAAAKAA